MNIVVPNVFLGYTLVKDRVDLGTTTGGVHITYTQEYPYGLATFMTYDTNVNAHVYATTMILRFVTEERVFPCKVVEIKKSWTKNHPECTTYKIELLSPFEIVLTEK